MAWRFRRRLYGGLTAVGGVLAVAAGVAWIDPRARVELEAMISGRGASGELMTAGQQLHNVSHTVMRAVRDQSIEHAPLTVFAIAAVVLLFVMTRIRT